MVAIDPTFAIHKAANVVNTANDRNQRLGAALRSRDLM